LIFIAVCSIIYNSNFKKIAGIFCVRSAGKLQCQFGSFRKDGHNLMNDKSIELFCDKMKLRLGASECVSFASRYESIAALFDAIEMGERECVYLSPLAPCDLIKALLACGVIPVFCDVTPDSLTLDHKMLENLVRHTISNGELYARAVIADNFCGMPFAAKAIKDICNRFGLILIEDCGECFGGTSDGMPCGAVGDYSIITLGHSSVFGTGGAGSILAAMDGNVLSRNIENAECGSGYQSVDEIYGENLEASADNVEAVLDKSRAVADKIEKALADSDFWVQRGNGRQKSSYGKITVIAQYESECADALSTFEKSGLLQYVRQVHVHNRNCFDRGCRGFKDISNAAAIAPRAFSADIFMAIHNSDADRLIEQFAAIAAN
jgi:dTDP-4-amino-4,6-dideoxygalactose transaminase